MTKADLSQWVTAATNIAVLFGVLLLVFELRQNAELARIEMIQGRINTNQQLESEFFEPHVTRIWVKSFMDPASMTLEEIRTMDAYMVVFMNQVMREYALEQAGLLDRGATARLMEENFWFLFGSPYAKVWWEQLGQSGLSPEIIELARPIVDSAEEGFLYEKFVHFQNSLGANRNASPTQETDGP
jgi:hypothetical protein